MAHNPKDDDPPNHGSSDEDILLIARRRFDLAAEAEVQMRIDALDDLNFLAGRQWATDIRASRDMDGRPSLTINRLPQFQQQLTNDQRQNRPSIKVNPVDDKATIETAKVFQGMIRHIEDNSGADVAYDRAFEAASGKGLGYFRVITEFSDPMSFDQEIKIKSVRNSFSCYLDPNHQEPDGSDANWGFVFENISDDDYKSQFPGSKLSSAIDWQGLGDRAPGWIDQSTVRISEYFTKSFKSVEIALLSTGEVFEMSKLPKKLPEGISIVKKRMTVLPDIKWYKLNGVEILERTDWLGAWIPIIPVIGTERDIDGKKILEGIVRHAKDPQRMYNYWQSAATETIALAPRAPFIGVEGQFEGFEETWKSANRKNVAYLEYKAKTIGGMPAAPPQRNVYEPPIQAISQAMATSVEDLKATTGIYDASLGNRSNEQSGVAIQRRNQQSQTGNFHYIDNLSRSIRHLGRILIDLIPKIYDTAGAQRILLEDGTPEMVIINQIFQKDGKDTSHMLDQGKYNCTIETGPSFATKRQESVASMLDFAKAVPQSAQFIQDLIARNMDWPGASDIADRLKKALPPGVADDPKDGETPIPPEVKQKMDQMSQMVQQLSQHLHAAQDEIDQKTRELESKERIAMAQVQANVEIELSRQGSKEAQTLLAHEMQAISQRLDLLKFNQQMDNDNQNLQNQQLASGGNNPTAQPQNSEPPTGGPSPGAPMGS